MKLYVFFTYNTTLKDWSLNGTLERELNYYNKFTKKGVSVTFVTYGINEKKFVRKYPKIKTISIYDDKQKSNFKIINLIKSFKFIISFSKYKNENLVIKSNQMKGSWLPLIISKIYNKKFILRSGYEYFRFATYTNNYSIKLFFIYILSLLSYKFSDKVIITNKFEKKYIIKKFNISKNKIKVIPNFIDTRLFIKKKK